VSDRRPPLTAYAPVTGRRAWLAARANGARLHAGADLAAPPGTRVFSPAGGTVTAVMHDADAVPGWRGYGPGVVVVRDVDGAHHVLAHVHPVAGLRVGAVVTAGAELARVSRMAHVHWEVRAVPMPPRGVAVVEIAADPLAWVAGRIVRWDGRCPPAPGDTARTPRACRPSWRGPRPAPVVPWPDARGPTPPRG
jgi:murein DD-endopeptidase MepM/ murein hydrolase activator NlpD